VSGDGPKPSMTRTCRTITKANVRTTIAPSWRAVSDLVTALMLKLHRSATDRAGLRLVTDTTTATDAEGVR
jgi:hypothetical protein